MKHLIDSSIWVALFLDFDTDHTKAARMFEKIDGTILLPYCVVNEVATVLCYKHSKAQADQFLAYIIDNQAINIVEDLPDQEIVWYQAVSKRISFTDAALILLAKKHGAELSTFDKQLQRLASVANR
jgi:predicted nucleic acid-binding protein